MGQYIIRRGADKSLARSIDLLWFRKNNHWPRTRQQNPAYARSTKTI